MKTMLNRRNFLKLGAGALAAAGTGCMTSRAADAKYSVLVLGDVHFDAPEIGVYHAHYKPTTGRAAEIFPLRMKREHDQWSGLMQRLAAAARKDIRPDTKFVLQLGDLILAALFLLHFFLPLAQLLQNSPPRLFCSHNISAMPG